MTRSCLPSTTAQTHRDENLNPRLHSVPRAGAPGPEQQGEYKARDTSQRYREGYRGTHQGHGHAPPCQRRNITMLQLKVKIVYEKQNIK